MNTKMRTPDHVRSKGLESSETSPNHRHSYVGGDDEDADVCEVGDDSEVYALTRNGIACSNSAREMKNFPSCVCVLYL
jgi:hypothetical protein